MTITHSIFIPVSAATSLGAVDDGKIVHVAVVAHFQVHADAPVDSGAGAVDVEVCDAAFDNLGDDLAGSLVGCHADSRPVARIQVLADYRGEVGGLDFVEGVAFFFVCVGERHSARVGGWHGGFDGFV